METFYKLNREKIKFAFITTSLALMGFVLFVLTIAFFTKNFPDKKLLIAIFITAGVVMPVFITLLSYIKWLFRQNSRKKSFSLEPFNQLKNIGFIDTFLNLNNKWHFTEIGKCLSIGGYTLIVDISEEFNRTIEVKVPLKWKKLEKNSFNKLSEKFIKHNMSFGVGCIKKCYKIDGQLSLSINELKFDLEKCISLIKDEGFKPSKKNFK